MGGGAHPPIPDYRIYKVEGIAELEKVQSRLAVHGLKDPWIRNEVWRYKGPGYARPGVAAFKSLTRGFKYGLAAFIITLSIEKLYQMSQPKTPREVHH